MVISITGTSRGITIQQLKRVEEFETNHRAKCIHHGDCIGADAQTHDLLLPFLDIEIHPPLDNKKRAFCKGAKKVWPSKPYLIRNIEIVECGLDGLIATPSGYTEILRSGTWSTIRMARKLKDTS